MIVDTYRAEQHAGGGRVRGTAEMVLDDLAYNPSWPGSGPKVQRRKVCRPVAGPKLARIAIGRALGGKELLTRQLQSSRVVGRAGVW